MRPCQKADLQGKVHSGPPLGPWDKVNRGLWTDVDRSVYLDSPLSIQVVAPKMQEKTLYEAMKIIDDAVEVQIRNKPSKARL